MQRPVQNFRDRRALLLMPDDRNCRALSDTLEKLGVTSNRSEPHDSDLRTESLIAAADVILVDTDTLEPAIVPLLANLASPVIALIGHESPSRLQRVLDIDSCSVLMKPIGPNGVYTSLFLAFNEHRKRRQSQERALVAKERSSARRIVVKAILQVMRTLGLDDEEAYRHLRKESMRRRISVEELSAQLLACGQERQRNQNTGA